MASPKRPPSPRSLEATPAAAAWPERVIRLGDMTFDTEDKVGRLNEQTLAVQMELHFLRETRKAAAHLLEGRASDFIPGSEVASVFDALQAAERTRPLEFDDLAEDFLAAMGWADPAIEDPYAEPEWRVRQANAGLAFLAARIGTTARILLIRLLAELEDQRDALVDKFRTAQAAENAARAELRAWRREAARRTDPPSLEVSPTPAEPALA